MASGKNIILLTPGFPENEQDTTCLPFLQDIVLSFNKLYPGSKLHILSFQYPFRKGTYQWHCNTVYSAGGKGKKNLTRLKVWRNIDKKFAEIVKREKVDGILSLWLTECSFIGQQLAKKYKLTHVAYLIGQDAMKKNLYLRLLRFSKMKIAAVSQSVIDIFYETTKYKVYKIVPLGILPVKFERAETHERDIDILGVGSLIPLKNYGTFIDIIGELVKEHPNLQSMIAGGGPLEEELKEKIKTFHLEKNIRMEGALPHSQIVDLMLRSRIFLHTSISEGQATVFNEALYCGLPIACFDVGRLEAEGRFFVCKNKEEMISSLAKLMAKEIDHKPILLRNMEDTVKELMSMFP